MAEGVRFCCSEEIMAEEIRIQLVTTNKEDMLTLLDEALGVEFVNHGQAWTAELFGGTSFTLVPDSVVAGRYELTILTDRSDPHFAKQQKAFGPIEGLPVLLTRALTAAGVPFQWI